MRNSNFLKKDLQEQKLKAEDQGKKVAVYFHDEASFSLTSDVGYTWFKTGHRPEIKASVSRSYWHLSIAADPESGDICPALFGWLNAETFQQYLNEFHEHVKTRIENGFEIWLAVDRAGWHIAKELNIPEGIKLIVMPTGAAKINPIETIWEYIRKNFTRCKIHKDLVELSETLYQACQSLLKFNHRVISICHTSMINKCRIV